MASRQEPIIPHAERNPSPWLTTEEGAAYLKIEPRTLLMWARQGKVKGYVMSGIKRRVWRFLRADTFTAVSCLQWEDSVRRRQGSVVLDRRISCWNFFWWDNGKRHSKKIGPLSVYPTKDSAWRAAKALRNAVETNTQVAPSITPTVRTIIEEYREEKMPTRYSTRRAYDVWLRLYILPRWGDYAITDLQARPVELWLQSLELAPRSKSGIRGMLRLLFDYAQWRGHIALQRNPMELVKLKGSTKRQRKPRSLTVEEFQKLIGYLEDPFRTIALVSLCFGLRISECLAIRWSDVDWLGARLTFSAAS